jgi:hypothetical protein
MDLDAPPFDCEVELLLQLFDDAFADKTERSDIVGENLQADGHGAFLSVQVILTVS